MKLKYYQDIEEMPVFHWFKVHSTSDYSWMLIKRHSLKQNEAEVLQLAWRSLYDQYLSAFGFSESYISIQEKKRQIALLQTKMILTGDLNIETFIEIKMHELRRIQKDLSGGSNFYEIKAHVEKQMGFQMDIRSTSVMEFYTAIKLISDGRK